MPDLSSFSCVRFRDGIYQGEMSENLRSGMGIFVESGIVQVGCFENDQLQEGIQILNDTLYVFW